MCISSPVLRPARLLSVPMWRSIFTMWMPAERKFLPIRRLLRRSSSPVRLHDHIISDQPVSRNLGRRAQADRHEDRADASIYVQLTVSFSEPACDIRRYEPAGSDFRADEF